MPPPGYPPPVKPRNWFLRHKILTVLIATPIALFVGLFMLGLLLVVTLDDQSTTANPSDVDDHLGPRRSSPHNRGGYHRAPKHRRRGVS